MKSQIILVSFEIFAYLYTNTILFILLSLIAICTYLMVNLRYSLILLPLHILTKIQGKQFNVMSLSKNPKEVKRIFKLTDKGRGVEEIFATKAWSPVLSIESVNSPLWETLRDNYIELTKYFPTEEKLAEIAKVEAKSILKNTIIDGRDISISTVKIFLKWIFCENDLPLNKEKDLRAKTQITNDSFKFINQFLNDNFLQELYEGSIEYRKEIAIKGKGCVIKKQNIINIIVDIILKSKYKDVFEDWKKDIFYSTIMQPLVISPMINMSDIAVSLKKHHSEYDPNNYKEFLDYVDMCIYKNHPFPVLERYEKETNTMHFLDLLSEKLDSGIINFGLGPRACLGRLFARTFLQNFFEPLLTRMDIYKPEVNHLYSGRDNDDNFSVSEGIYQMKMLLQVVYEEYKYTQKLKSIA